MKTLHSPTVSLATCRTHRNPSHPGSRHTPGKGWTEVLGKALSAPSTSSPRQNQLPTWRRALSQSHSFCPSFPPTGNGSASTVCWCSPCGPGAQGPVCPSEASAAPKWGSPCMTHHSTPSVLCAGPFTLNTHTDSPHLLLLD